MDNSNRRKLGSNEKSNFRKFNEEPNGNSGGRQREISYKAHNTRKSQRKSKELHNKQVAPEWMNDYHPNYMPLQGQRLFAAVSDPAVCGYPMSLRYPFDPIPVSIGFPFYQTAPHPHRVPYKEPVTPKRKSRLRNTQEETTHSRDVFQPVDEYTSLPPSNIPDFESDHQRRFSDPGLANATGSDDESISNYGSQGSWYDEGHVTGQIEFLMQENRRLSKELHETRSEVQELKLEVQNLSHIQSSYEPGCISDLVREVRDATKCREDALFSRLQNMLENGQRSSNLSSLPELRCRGLDGVEFADNGQTRRRCLFHKDLMRDARFDQIT